MTTRGDDATAATDLASDPTTASTPHVTGALADALLGLARGQPTDLTGLLHEVEAHAEVQGTRVTAHCHCLKYAQGRPKVEHLVRFIAEQVTSYAIPRSNIREAGEHFLQTGSPEKFNRLHRDARGLFTHLTKSGEGGELLLFVLAEKLLGLPQLICKMDLKTSAPMHVHGADGLHAGVDADTGNLVLYWGESKIYKTVVSAVRDCLASLGPMVTSYANGERDLQLLQRHADLDDADLEAALKNFLDPSSEAFNSLEFRGLCLVGFDCDAYPSGSTVRIEDVVSAVLAQLPSWKTDVESRVIAEKLREIAMHFVFVPFPDVDEFRKMLRKELGIDARDASPAPTADLDVAEAEQRPDASRVTARPSRGRRASAEPASGVPSSVPKRKRS